MQNRDGFTSSIGVTLATLGSAVGLGNIWKFPFLTGMNGGASFLAVYMLCTLAVGLPVMISELLVGRHAKANAIDSYRKLSPKGQPWWLIGVAGVLSAFLIMAFYSEVAGWVFAYVFKSIGHAVSGNGPADTGAMFDALVTDPVQSLVWQWGVLLFVGCIILLGVAKGIERTVKRLMPLLFALLVVVCVRSLTLPGASEGLAFLFKPDFSKINATVVLMAMGLAFFKLSIGMGCMTTYGSYYRDDQNVPLTAFRVMISDLTVSILAGIAVFPAVFSFGFKADAGPSLLFITLPAVFDSMPLGGAMQVAFFVLTAVAATGAMLSIFEVPVAFAIEAMGWSRRKAVIVTGAALAVMGAPAALTNSLTSDWEVFGMNFFDLYDFLSSNIMLPLAGMSVCVFVAWVWGADAARKAMSNNGSLHMGAVAPVFLFLVKYLTPVAVFAVLLNGLGVFG